jgi:hypothetical protein
MGAFFITVFLISFLMVIVGVIEYAFISEKKERGLKLLIYGIIGLVIGFGSCFAIINIA